MISKKIQLLCGIALSIGAFADTINGSKTFFQDYLETKLKLDTQDHHLHQVRELLLGPWMSSFFEHCKDPSMQKKMSEFIINFENAYFNYFTLENSESFNPEPLATYSLLVHLMSRLENENAFQFDKIGAKDLAFIENILRQVEAKPNAKTVDEWLVFPDGILNNPKLIEDKIELSRNIDRAFDKLNEIHFSKERCGINEIIDAAARRNLKKIETLSGLKSPNPTLRGPASFVPSPRYIYSYGPEDSPLFALKSFRIPTSKLLEKIKLDINSYKSKHPDGSAQGKAGVLATLLMDLSAVFQYPDQKLTEKFGKDSEVSQFIQSALRKSIDAFLHDSRDIFRRLSSIQINDRSYPSRDEALKLINEFYSKALEAQNAINALISKLNVSTAVSEAHEKTEYVLYWEYLYGQLDHKIYLMTEFERAFREYIKVSNKEKYYFKEYLNPKKIQILQKW